MILKTKFTPKNEILAINQIVISKIQYCFGIIAWPQHEIIALDISTRKLVEIDAIYKATINSLAQYIVTIHYSVASEKKSRYTESKISLNQKSYYCGYTTL